MRLRIPSGIVSPRRLGGSESRECSPPGRSDAVSVPAVGLWRRQLGRAILVASLAGAALATDTRAASESAPAARGESLPGHDATPDAARPNIVMIVADDHGYRDFGFMGAPSWVKTPNLDALAAGGTTFPFAYSTASVCAPALQSLLTGLAPYEVELRLADLWKRRGGFGGAEPIRYFDTLPRQLSAHGYATYQVGKYWEGTYHDGGFTHGTKVTPTAPGMHLGERSGGEGLRVGRETLAPVLDFIDAHAAQPFFIWFAPSLPHVPFDAPEKFRLLYREAPVSYRAKRYLANVSRLDEVVGTVLAHLDARRFARPTFVVFLADNGWDTELPPVRPGDTTRDPRLLGGPRGKLSLYELGVRTPIVFRWAGRIPAGQRRDALVSIVDVMPTVLDLAGITPPSGLSGTSLRPVLEGRAPALREVIVGRISALRQVTPAGAVLPKGTHGYFVRTQDWYYVMYGEGLREELYDARSDPGQEHDVAGAHPAVTAQLRRRIDEWKEGIGERLRAVPTRSTPFDALR
jgi:uncharacterized sulfatase